jgi:WXXGXW repeat (2 copies)
MRTQFFLRSLLILLGMLALSTASYAQVAIGVSVAFAPPELPVYEQPICPGDGYIWTPGYWAWDDGDYYWVPGTWVLAPEVGSLWTPGYWGWGGNGFVFHEGYWGPQIGFYGGINYGFGYFGHGYEGGRWDQGHFYYNRAASNVNVLEIHNVYNTTVVNRTVTRVSYSGGNGGINERPTREEESVAHERHLPPVSAQTQHVQAARANRELRVSENHGKPPVAATPRPGAFSERGAVPAKEGGRYNPRSENNAPARSENNAPPRTENNASPPSKAIHPKELPSSSSRVDPNTGNPNLDKKYQQQQEKLQSKQNQERQKLQQKQDLEHQRQAQQKANDAQKQKLEQRHQQQTQQQAQKHVQQQQKMQQHQQPPH